MAVRESRDRVKGAIESCGFQSPQQRTIINLAPADMKKAGSRFDLPIALGILAASRQLDADQATRYEFYGELALNGDIRPVPGILPSALRATQNRSAIFVPAQNVDEALLAEADVYAAGSLAQVVSHLNGQCEIEKETPPEKTYASDGLSDLADVRGQQKARRALEIAAAGGHNLLLNGPPGTGKSMLAQRMPGILPPPDHREAIESAAVRSILGQTIDANSLQLRPFRAPHHTASAAALVGGGSEPRPGEVSLAHNGVLFLDELPEFSRHVLEVLREPLETGLISISRAGGQADFPARFQLIAAMNPCPCGFLGDPAASCRCSADKVANYMAKISGPLLDRIDIHVDVQRPPRECLRPDAAPGETTALVRERVSRARTLQICRQGFINARLDGNRLHELCNGSPGAWRILDKAMERFPLSARAHQRIWRVARTVADLDGHADVGAAHLSEALSLRNAGHR